MRSISWVFFFPPPYPCSDPLIPLSHTQKGEGLELETVQIENFTQNPAFLDVIEDELYKGFVSTVNGYWSLLVR